MRELRRRADGLILLAAPALVAAVILLAAGRSQGPAIEPGPVSGSGAGEQVSPPHPELLPGEFRGPGVEEVMDELEWRHRDESLMGPDDGWSGSPHGWSRSLR